MKIPTVLRQNAQPLLLGTAAVFSIGLAFLAVDFYQKQQDRQKQQTAMRTLMAGLPKLKPGMSEDQASQYLGRTYSSYCFQTSPWPSSPTSVHGSDLTQEYCISENPPRYLQIYYTLRDVKQLNGMGYLDTKTGKDAIGIYQAYSTSNNP